MTEVWCEHCRDHFPFEEHAKHYDENANHRLVGHIGAQWTGGLHSKVLEWMRDNPEYYTPERMPKSVTRMEVDEEYDDYTIVLVTIFYEDGEGRKERYVTSGGALASLLSYVFSTT